MSLRRSALRMLMGVLAAAFMQSTFAAAIEPARDQAIPSCFDGLRDVRPAAPQGDLTVLIDQTAWLDERLRQIVHETVDHLIRPGTNVSVAVFSAYMRGRYLDVLVSGQIEAPIADSQRDFVSKRDLHTNDKCLGDQLAFAHRLVNRTIDRAFAGINSNIARSDILTALRDVSQRIDASPASRRMLILVSDMLENSSITNFYHAARLRGIDPDVELHRVASAGIRADFAGARVYVIDGGGISDSTADYRSYRDPRALIALEDFWRRWFAASHADLVDFGKPTPLVRIDWDQPDGGAPQVH